MKLGLRGASALLFVWALSLVPRGIMAQSPQNGIIDGLDELVTRQEVMFPMSDGTPLATDVFRPILSDDLAFGPIELDLGALIGIPGIGVFSIDRIKLGNKGLQFYQYPNQADPFSLPALFTRTPYNKSDPVLGQVVSLLGYQFVHQDMRGRYASAGVYLPMFSDSWAKSAYIPYNHPLDTTAAGEAKLHQDGFESVKIISQHLRLMGDSVVVDTNPLSPLPYANNGRLGMFGASALGNTQFQAAAVEKINPADSVRGLKCLVPIVASGEFYHSTGHQNGVFRERIIDGWLRGQVEQYDFLVDSTDQDVYNFTHSLQDYGYASTGILTSRDAAESAIDFWTTMHGAHYPNTPARAVMDISHATIDASGNAVANGPVSRYTNMEVPTYSLTGWWDIFIDGQIQTWQLMRQHLSQTKHLQKLVIGPWAHQTIGSRATGDQRETPEGDYRYPENVTSIIGIDIDDFNPEQLGDIGQSEAISWYRKWLGEPTVVLPPLQEWQFMANVLGSDVYVMVPADTFSATFTEFFNFIGGSGPLNNLPVRIKGISFVDSNTVQNISIPALGTSLLGPDYGTFSAEAPGNVEWDDSKPNGVKPVRFYVAGPVNDGIHGVWKPQVGNYWYAADTFPLPNTTSFKLYFRGDSSLSEQPASTFEGEMQYIIDPDNPPQTHGGGNMIVKTPDQKRDSQGQMNFLDPDYVSQVLNRYPQYVNGTAYYDILQFTSDYILDSLSIAGFGSCTFYAKSNPVDLQGLDSTSTDFHVRVLDVTPDGRELFVFEGAMGARAREYARSWADGAENENAPWSNLVPDSIYEFKLPMLPIAYTFGHNHRIKVLVSSGNYPRYQPGGNLPIEPGEFYRRRPFEAKSYDYYGQTLFPRKAINSFLMGDQYPAHLDLPMLGSTSFSPVNRQAELKLQPKLLVYPNPAQGTAHVHMNLPGTYNLQLLNPMGQVVQEHRLNQHVQLNLSTLPAGLYVLQVSNPQGYRSSQKLLVR